MRLLKRASSGVAAAVLALSSILTLVFPGIAHAATYTCTWTGGGSDNKFSTSANWSGANCPPTGGGTNTYNLVFDLSTISSGNVAGGFTWTLNNDLSGLAVGSITFQGNSSSFYTYTLTGNAMTLGGGIADTSSGNNTISANLTLGASQSFTTGKVLNIGDSGTPGTLALSTYTLTIAGTPSSCGGININDAVTGSGGITNNNTYGFALTNSNTGYTGMTTVNAGRLLVGSAHGLGADSAQATVASGGTLNFGVGSTTTFANPLSLSGSGVSGGSTLETGAAPRISCGGGGGGGGASSVTTTLSGAITLGSDIAFGGASDLTITGAVSGAHAIAVAVGSQGSLVMNSSNNGSQTPNGTSSAPVTSVTVAAGDNQPNQAVDVGKNVTETLDGQRGATTVDSGGLLKGTGQANSLFVSQGGTVAPGHSPGALTVVSTLSLYGTYQAELKDKSTGDFDQIVVGSSADTTGNDVTLGDGTTTFPTLDVELYSGASIKSGDTFTIVNNLSATPVSGTFNGLPEGATFKVGNGTMKISYVGGDGNDIVLTAMSNISAPDTGFAMVTAHPVVTLGVTALAAGVIFGAARRAGRKLAPVRAKATRTRG